MQTLVIIAAVWLFVPLPIAWALCRSAAVEDRAMERWYAHVNATEAAAAEASAVEVPGVSTPGFPDVVVDIAPETAAPVTPAPVAPPAVRSPSRTA